MAQSSGKASPIRGKIDSFPSANKNPEGRDDTAHCLPKNKFLSKISPLQSDLDGFPLTFVDQIVETEICRGIKAVISGIRALHVEFHELAPRKTAKIKFMPSFKQARGIRGTEIRKIKLG